MKFSLFKIVIYPGIELEYEHLLNQTVSIGGNVSYIFNDNHPFYDFFIDAYSRLYFNQHKEFGMDGFFAQAYLSF